MSRRCGWIDRDAEGRPSCQHGPAHKAGDRWRCPHKAYVNNRKYDRTEKGREYMRRLNATDAARSSKELYELTRIRVS